MSDSEEDKKPAAKPSATNHLSAVLPSQTAATAGSPTTTTTNPTTTATTPTRVKPALKKKDKAKVKHDKRLKWDEQKIKEHDQLRGTRMKIDEPNTPYLHYSDSSEGAESDDSKPRPKSPAQQKPTLSWDTLQTKLDSVAAVQHIHFPDSPDDEGRRQEMRRLEFKEHRKRHYNEFELVKKFRQEHPHDADVEDGNLSDDDDDE